MANTPIVEPTQSAILAKLGEFSKDTDSHVIDLRGTSFKKEGEWGVLEFDNQRYHLTEWSARQFCKLSSIPFSMYKRASAELDHHIVSEFLPMLKDEKQQALLAIRLGSKKDHRVRGLLSVDHTDLRNFPLVNELFTFLEGPSGKLSDGAQLRECNFLDSKDEPEVLRLRFDLKSCPPIDLGVIKFAGLDQHDELTLGCDVTFSEVGGCPFQINLVVRRQLTNTGVLVRVGAGPYFHFMYAGAMPKALSGLFRQAAEAVESNQALFQTLIMEVRDLSLDLTGAKNYIRMLKADERLGKGVLQKTWGHLESHNPLNEWDFAHGLAVAAQDYRDLLRLRYEGVAGELCKLQLSRSADEDETMLGGKFKSQPPVTEVIPL